MGRPQLLLWMCLVTGLSVTATAQQQQPSLSRSVDAAAVSNASAPGDVAAPRNKSVIPIHARLAAYEQCGGELGLCKTTTIGVPCGDHPWDTIHLPCPDGYSCARQTQSFWQCTPVLGKKNASSTGPAAFKTAAPGAARPATPQQAPSASPAGFFGPLAANGSSSNGSSSSNDSDASTPEVKACKQGEYSVGNRCFKGSVPTGNSGGSSGRASAAALLLLAGAQLAATLLLAGA